MDVLANALKPDIFNIEVPDLQRKLVDEPVNVDLIDKNKYANNSSFVPDSIYRRILNQLTNYRWSFVPHETKWEEKSVTFTGLLVVPGFGIHTGIGSVKLDKKDNSNALSSAKTYAFKNACKEMGLAPNVGDDKYEELLFEKEVSDYIDSQKEKISSKPKKKKTDTINKKPATTTGKKSTSTKTKVTLKEQIEEIKLAYEITNDDDLVAFLQIWDKDVIDLDEITKEDWMAFFKYFNKNKSEFEDF